MKLAFAHIGAHKTASTFLQANLNLHEERLNADCNLTLLTRAQLNPSAFGQEIYRVSQGDHPHTIVTEEAYNSLQELLSAGPTNVLLTNEDLICHLEIQDFYQDAESAIRYLRTVLDGYDLHVIFYVRRQWDYLESIYMQYVHLGRRLRFEQFMERAGPVDLSWTRAAEAMERALPPGRLHLRTYEQIREIGESAFFRDFLKLCQVKDADTFDVDEEFAKGRPANRSYGKLGMQIARRVNPLLNPKERKLFRRFLQEHFSTATHPRAELLDDERKLGLQEKYRDANRRLFQRFDLGVNGETLGYY